MFAIVLTRFLVDEPRRGMGTLFSRGYTKSVHSF